MIINQSHASPTNNQKQIQIINPHQNHSPTLVFIFFNANEMNISVILLKERKIYKMQADDYTIFLFINSGSGGGVGKKLVEQQIQKVNFNLGQKVELYFFNMRKDKEVGFNKLKECVQNDKKVIAVICGGDGTVMWVVSQLANHQIDQMKVPLAIIPLGTGNDFSQNLGWGKQQKTLTQNSFQTLKILIKDWISAKDQTLDVWQMSLDVFENGKFQKVEDSKDKDMEVKSIQKHFVNYFSFGIDGHVGYQFDKHRTTSRLGNLAVYGAMGLATGMQKIKNLGELVQAMTTHQNQKEEVIFVGDKKRFIDYLGGNPFEFNFNDLVEGVKSMSSFNKNQNLLALNINSYMGGVTDIWKKGKENPQIKSSIPETDQSHQDGKLEFVSFANTGVIGLEKAFGKISEVGFAQKIIQGAGPFNVYFRQYPDEDDHRTFLQIDGEFIKVTHPRHLIIKKSSMFPNSKIRVLHKNDK